MTQASRTVCASPRDARGDGTFRRSLGEDVHLAQKDEHRELDVALMHVLHERSVQAVIDSFELVGEVFLRIALQYRPRAEYVVLDVVLDHERERVVRQVSEQR